MKVGDLVKDKITGQMGIIINFHWQDDEDETYAEVQLYDNSKTYCAYEDIELIACPNP